MKDKKIGLYGGSFDPIHIGHLSLAVELMEAGSLDEVWFCPSAVSPFKELTPLFDIPDRCRMIELAIQPIKPFKWVDLEIKRPAPSYTIDTLRELTAKHPSHQFYLMMGDDSAKHFSRWKEAEEIIKLAKLLVGRRTLSPNTFEGSSPIEQAIAAGMHSTRLIEISSTEIRERLKKGLCIAHLVPLKVLDDILLNRLK
jgi:nicotinate-nucleotide adenylyltransferase